MASSDGITIEIGPGLREWQRWAAALEGNFQRANDKATKKACEYVKGHIVRRIRARDYAPLAALTAWGRKAEGLSTVPLMRNGGLTKAIASEIRGSGVGAVGLSKSGPHGTQLANVGKLLHDGGTIKVTNRMRRAFVRRLMALSKKTNSAPPGGDTRKAVIRIKPRRFIADVFNDRKVQAKIQAIYIEEFEKALAGRGVRRT